MNDLVPTEFYLGQNFPNPFKEKTTIKYCVAYKTRVRITVFDTEGEIIEKLVDEEKNVGTHKTEFLAKDRSVSGGNIQQTTNLSTGASTEVVNKQLTSGIYFYQLKAGNYVSTKKMILLK